MAYVHGVSVSEVPTSVVSPVSSFSGLPVVVGTAPINLADSQEYVNKPLLVYTYTEAVSALGYSSDWEKFTLCEFIKSHFQLFNVAPVVFINVLDSATHKTDAAAADINISDGTATISVEGILLNTLVVKLDSSSGELVLDTDYTAGFDDNGYVVISPIDGAGIEADQTTLNVAYTSLDPSLVDSTDIIGGTDLETGEETGLELINRVFPLYRMVPGQILAPGFSHDSSVAAVMKAKADNVNGLFKAIPLCDVDSTASGADLYTKVPDWKNTNNYTDPLQIVCWPKVKLGDETYHLSTQVAGLICQIDGDNDDIPYVSPSNKSLQADSAVIDSGEEVALGPDQASYLNGEGIVTALNFTGGWKLWGNRTAAYPSNTDVKDSFIPVRRMFNWIANTIILTFWAKVDDPANKRLIDTVVDSINIWLNGLTAKGALLGGRVEFLSEENPTTDLLSGIVRFHIYLSPQIPGLNLEFVQEYDVSYLDTLFE